MVQFMSLLLTRTKNPNAKLLQVIWPAASFPHSPAFSHSKPLTVPQHGPDSLCVDCSFPRCPQGSLAPSLRADGKMLLPHRSIPRMCYLIQIHHLPSTPSLSTRLGLRPIIATWHLVSTICPPWERQPHGSWFPLYLLGPKILFCSWVWSSVNIVKLKAGK